MKKIFTTAVIAASMLCVSNSTQAQIKFGVKGGLNVTNMSLDSKVLDADNQTGFFIGPTVKFTLPLVGLGVDASALYDQREAKIKDTDAKLKSQAINVPINLRYGVGLGSLANVYVFAGPQFGFNVGDKEHKITDGATWNLKSSSFSVNVGLGATLMSHLQVSANYNIACGKTGDVTVGSAVSDAIKGGDGKANAWQIGLAYYF